MDSLCSVLPKLYSERTLRSLSQVFRYLNALLETMQSKWFILKASLKTLGLETRLTDTEQVYKPIQASIAVCFVLFC